MTTTSPTSAPLNPLLTLDLRREISSHQREANHFLNLSRISLVAFCAIATVCIAGTAFFLPSYIFLASGLMLPAAQKFFEKQYNPLNQKYLLHLEKIELYQRVLEKLPSEGAVIKAYYAVIHEDSNRALERLSAIYPEYRQKKRSAKLNSTETRDLAVALTEKLNLQFMYCKIRMEEFFLAYIDSNPTSLASYKLSAEPLGRSVAFKLLPDITTYFTLSNLVKAHKDAGVYLARGQQTDPSDFLSPEDWNALPPIPADIKPTRLWTDPRFAVFAEKITNKMFIQKFREHDIRLVRDTV